MSKFGFVPNSAKLTIIDTDGEEYCTFEDLTLSVERLEEQDKTTINFNLEEEQYKKGEIL